MTTTTGTPKIPTTDPAATTARPSIRTLSYQQGQEPKIKKESHLCIPIRRPGRRLQADAVAAMPKITTAELLILIGRWLPC